MKTPQPLSGPDAGGNPHPPAGRRRPWPAALLAGLLLLAGAPALFAEGTRTLHPASGPGSTGNRGVMDTSANLVGNVARSRQFTYVYAQAGEVILLGQRNRSNGGNIFVYGPQASFGNKGDETWGTAVFTCSTQTGRGTIASRAQELAGPNSADLTATVPNGFDPCWYVAPTTGIYGVRFTQASSGNQTNTALISDPVVSTTLVSAWDVTVRPDVSSLDDLNGRVFTYAWAIYLTANNRYLENELHYVSSDGYRYRQTFRGADPNRAVFFANAKGFIDGGAPLYKDVRGSNQNVNAGTSFSAGVTVERPAYPIFFSDVDPAGPNAAEVNRVLTALAIPHAPLQPLLTSPTFVGNMGGHTSTVSAGGLFTFDTQNTLTYEIVIRRGAVAPGADPNHPAGCLDDYDPANVCNRVLTGVALTGSHAILWDGLDNDGHPFPIGNYDFQIVGRNGEIHFPMFDLEGNRDGGPTLEKLNGFNTAEATTVYFDDRGHRTANNTLIGQLNGHLCGATNQQQQPVPNHSLTGVDSADPNWNGSGHYYRYWTGSNDSNTDCVSAATEYFGTAKGLDVWALERSPLYVEPVEIVEEVDGVDVGTMATMTPAVLPGETSYGNFTFYNAGDQDATGVTYGVTLGNPAIPATCPAAVTFTVVPAGVTATYNPAPACTITFTGMPTTLAVGETLLFAFNYVVAPTNPGPIPLDTVIAAANETTPPYVAPNTAHAETVVATPEVAVRKAASPAAGSVVNVGDTITYTITATISNAPLTADLTIDDTLGTGLTWGAIVSQSPQFTCGGSLTCTLPAGTGIGSYSVTYTATVDSSAGLTVANEVTIPAGGGDDDPACTDCSLVHDLGVPGLSITKTVTSGAGPYGEGDTISYELVVINTGNVTLTGVSIDDPNAVLGSCTPIALPGDLLAGQTTTCTATHVVTAADVAAGNVHNSATAAGTPPATPGNPNPPPIDSPPGETDTPISNPGLSVVKSVTSGAGPYALGETITYSLVVTNTGNVTLTNVTVSDPNAVLGACTPIALPGTLTAGQTTTCTATHVVTADDVAAGTVHNSATVAGTPPATPGNPNPDPVVTPPSETDSPTGAPGLTIVKSVTSGPGPYGQGQTITYALVVTNTGALPLTNVSVDDPNAVLGTCAPIALPGTLNPGESTTCSATHEVTADDAAAGVVINSATASGTPPATPGNPNPPPIVTPPSVTDSPVTEPGLQLVKSAGSPGPYEVGDVVEYFFTVTNTGTSVLEDVSISDPLPGLSPIGDCDPIALPGTLNPGDSTTCTATYVITAADVTAGSVQNTAIATGMDTTTQVSVSSSDTVTVETRQKPVTEIPTLGPWMLALLAALLGLFGWRRLALQRP